MTISTTASRISYSGNGSTDAFSFPYFFKNQADLKVVLVAADGTETLQVLSSNYTIAGTVFNGAYNSGGTINMSVAPSNTQTLVIYRDPAVVQELDLVENDSLPAESLERALDQGVAISQRLGDRVNRSVRLAEGYTGSFDPILPGVTPANTALVVNTDGDGLAFGPTTAQIADAAGNAAAASASAIAAAASASGASGSADAAAASATAAGLSEAAALASETAAGLSEAAAAASETAAGSVATSTATSVATSVATGIANGSAAFANVTPIDNTDSPVTLLASDMGKVYSIDASGGNVAITLPAVAGVTTVNKSFTFIRTDSSANDVTITRGSTDTVRGGTNYEITKEFESAIFVPDTAASDWQVIPAGSGGGAGEGGVNFLPEVRLSAFWAGFNETTYADGAGGALAGLAITDNTTTPVSSPSDLKIAKSAVDAQGSGFSIDTITIDPEFRGTRAYLKFFYDATSANYTADDLVIKVYDVTNSAILGVTGIQNLGTAGEIKKISDNAIAAITIPATCAAIRVSLWLETDSATGSAWDVFVSTRIKLVPDAPVVRDYQPLRQFIEALDTTTTFGSTRTGVPVFTTTTNTDTGLISVVSSAANGTEFLALKSCVVDINATCFHTSASTVFITRNATTLTAGVPDNVIARQSGATNFNTLISTEISLAANDVIRIQRSATAVSQVNTLSLVATEVTQPAIVSGNELAFKPIKFVATKASGACTADTTIPAWVVDAGNETGNFNATTGVFTSPKKMMAYVSFQPLFTTNAVRGTQIRKNGNVWVAEPGWVTSTRMSSVSSLINLEPGDTVTTVSGGTGGTLDAPTTFTLHEIPDLSVFAAHGFPDPPKLNTASGAAPSYSARAWVRFDGSTTPPAIGAAGNVSSVSRTATGRFTINFTTAMDDVNFAMHMAVNNNITIVPVYYKNTGVADSASSVSVGVSTTVPTDINPAQVFITVFR